MATQTMQQIAITSLLTATTSYIHRLKYQMSC